MVRSRCTRGIAWVLCGLLLALSGCGGCGGGSKRDPYAPFGGLSKEEWDKLQEEKKKEEAEDDARVAAAAKNAKEAEANKRQEAQAQKRAAAEKMAEGLKKEQPQRSAASSPKPDTNGLPDDVTQWKDADFFLARMADDPRLISAIASRAARSSDKEQDVALFVKLLAPNETGEAGTVISRATNAAAKARIETVVAAMGVNGTPMAWDALTRILAGSLSVEDDRAGVEAALKILAERGRPEYDALLVRVITAAAEVRPRGQGTMTAEEIRGKALALITAGASERLRARLAKASLDPATPADVRGLLDPLLKPARPENFEAHLVLYGSATMDTTGRGTLEKEFLDYGREALAMLYGLAPARSTAAPSADWPHRVAKGLWDPRFADIVNLRQSAMKSMKEDAGVVLLASTLPIASVRERLERTLLRHWDDGPAALRAAGLASTVVSEPGFLVVLKAAHDRAAGGRRASPAPRLLRQADLRQSAARPNPARSNDEDWRKAEEDLLRSLCGRFHEAALARSYQGDRVGFSDLKKVAIVPHSPEAVTDVFRLTPTEESRKQFASLDFCPVSGGYLRIDERARPDRVLSYYRRELTRCEVHPLATAIWFESMETFPKGRRSIDVLISAKGPMGKGAAEERELTTEILWIDLPETDAKGAAPDPQASAAARNSGEE